MAKIHGGEMVVRALEREGVRELFALPGEHIDPVLEAANAHGFRIIDTRHEQAAGHMADGWARTTGRPGVAVVTAGPGVTDIVTAVANAFCDAVPMLVIGGRSGLMEDEALGAQSLPQVDFMRPITKWAGTAFQPHRIAEFVTVAYRQAVTGRPGPVYLDIPLDVIIARVDEERVLFPEAYRPEAPPAARPEAVERALDLLERAERPAIMAGGGIWFAGAAAELREFAELTQTPVFANEKARGCVPEDTPLGFGSFVPIASGRPDVVLILGARLGLFTGGRHLSLIPREAKVIQVDILGEEIGRNREIQLGIVGDCREVLRQLLEGARRRRWPQRESLAGDAEQRARRPRPGLRSGAGGRGAAHPSLPPGHGGNPLRRRRHDHGGRRRRDLGLGEQRRRRAAARALDVPRLPGLPGRRPELRHGGPVGASGKRVDRDHR